MKLYRKMGNDVDIVIEIHYFHMNLNILAFHEVTT